jgi:hypothetical protein
MFIKILIALAVLVIIFVVIVSMRPDEFRVSRSISISAPPSLIFLYLNNQQKGNEWSPWMKLDPNMKQTFSGPDSGVGSAASWDGNNQVGAGTSTIVESRADESVTFRLDFLRPFKGTSTAEITLKPEGNGNTLVTWSMFGPANFISKAMGLFMDCEKMCGDQFNTGLQQLKTLVENSKG